MKMPLNATVGVIVLLLLMGIGIESASASTWQIGTVVTQLGYPGQDLALDPTTGYPRVSYVQTNWNSDSGWGNIVTYMTWDGSAWQNETVDDYSVKAFGLTSLVLDPTTGYPRISYYNQTNQELKYAAWDGSAWRIETVDDAMESSTGSLRPSLALDPITGYPRISYITCSLKEVDSWSYTESYLKFAAWDGSAWQIETVDDSGDSEAFTSLALDPTTGYPRISYSGLKYAAWDGSAWQIETVDTMGGQSSLALDPTTGYPRIVYPGLRTYEPPYWHALKYAAWDGSAWQIELVDYATFHWRQHERDPDLVLDPTTGYPRICYRFGTTFGDLKYIAWDGSAWQIETVDSMDDYQMSSIALDPSTGCPRICYYGRYAALLPTTPSITGITVPPDSIPVNTAVGVSGTFIDPDTGDYHAAVWDWGDSSTSVGIVTKTNDAGTVTGSHTYSTPGIHTVTLTVTDSYGSFGTETTSITVKTPAEAISDLIAYVEGLGLPPGIENALTVKLDHAIEKLNEGKDKTVISNLNAFIDQVEDEMGQNLTDEEANTLIAIAQKIINSI